MSPRHVYIIGAKSVGLYGGYESFVMKLLQEHQGGGDIRYHVAVKANGEGCMDLGKIPGIVPVTADEFDYCGARCHMIPVPEWIGAAQAIVYDLRALRWACQDIERNRPNQAVVYILASRIGPFERRYVKRIRRAGGRVFQNPDGHENWRRKWRAPVRAYWKLSERLSVKFADLVICDNRHIETYIREEYAGYCPDTVFIPYGSDTTPSALRDDDSKYVNWLAAHGLQDRLFIISVGRFVPENNFDIMIREFMRSRVDMDFVIIATENPKFAAALQRRYNFRSDTRIKFVGTVYDAQLLAKIRENAAAYIHGHEVGGTNPSLLESMGKTRVNLLYDVCFNREVGADASLYWTKEPGSLAALLDTLPALDADDLGRRARARMEQAYSWKFVAEAYEKVF